MKVQADEKKLVPSKNHERHFYSTKRAFGRFGIRVFDPVVMAQPHWHGHIEVNFANDFEMDYVVDGEPLTLPANRLVVFWAGVPHQLIRLHEVGAGPFKQSNIYLPLDAFLMMNHIAGLQVSLLSGAMIVLPEDLGSIGQMQRWYTDYRSGDFERSELVKMELNALFRRASLDKIDYLRRPKTDLEGDRTLSSAHIRHVIAMVRHVLENLEKPLRNADITLVTGLHENYALSLFTRVMQVPLKQFLIRMRLMRARALLVESSMAIAAVVQNSGFSSISQFYHQFREAYGMTPNALREQYMQKELR